MSLQVQIGLTALIILGILVCMAPIVGESGWPLKLWAAFVLLAGFTMILSGLASIWV